MTDTNNAHPYEIGRNILIRTVTMILCGRLVEVYPNELVLVDAAWIADTERFKLSVEQGIFIEVEPYPDGDRVIVGRGALIDAVHVNWELPRDQK